ncbi:transcriptional regulator [Streptomyces sp. SID335]|nr:transcriptional regulator [Streptomyces sp. SID335]MYZ18219.1 transcriptional regulator [Streptomyces sp. SID337]NDZ91652.1 helix-turn-helix transcriptional regulator [Streptomyces sp. SID10115]NEA00679.1 helix-turn-helix transcriptional regulator [Streptomyces sp. SID10116]NEB45826.1 helix-turn-helix transcriptional regulator [Streptomyces sp. SID339]
MEPYRRAERGSDGRRLLPWRDHLRAGRALRGNGLRIYEPRDSIQGSSERMLARTSRALVEDGPVRRPVEPTSPLQVTYGLTEFGQDLVEPLTDPFDRITQRLPPRAGK